jgi:RNA polymerase sigma-70 factor (ECF subfamily)
MSPSPQSAQEEDFRALLRENHGRLVRIARSYASAGEHEDLLQEMLLQLWRALPGYDARASRATWVYRVALNTAMDHLRKRYARPVTQAMDHAQLMPLTPASTGDPVDAEALLESFLAALTPIDRAVLMLSLDDLSYAQIAEVTGLNENAVGLRLHRIKQRFNQMYLEDPA